MLVMMMLTVMMVIDMDDDDGVDSCECGGGAVEQVFVETHLKASQCKNHLNLEASQIVTHTRSVTITMQRNHLEALLAWLPDRDDDDDEEEGEEFQDHDHDDDDLNDHFFASGLGNLTGGGRGLTSFHS